LQIGRNGKVVLTKIVLIKSRKLLVKIERKSNKIKKIERGEIEKKKVGNSIQIIYEFRDEKSVI